jgi:hypothetical protein
MQARFSGFFSKFFFEILPATLASAAAGFLFAHFGMPTFQQATQQAAAVSPVSEEMLKMVHDDHEAFVGYLKKAAEKQEAPGGAAAQQAEARLKQEEQSAALAIRQAKEAEAKALAATRAAERKVAARTQVQARAAAPTSLAPPEAPLGQLVVSRQPAMAPAQQPLGAVPPPLPTTVIATPAPRVIAPAPQPAVTADASDSHWSVGGALHRATSSVTGLFTADAPPRPPGAMPQQNFSNASDVIGSER